MTETKAKEILTVYNAWRRGEGVYSIPGSNLIYSNKEIGEAIDYFITR